MGKNKPNYPYVPLQRKESRLTKEDQKQLDELTLDWERSFLGDNKPTGGFTEWLREQKPKAPL